MKNDSKLSLACWGGEHGACMGMSVAPLIPQAWSDPGSRDKGKDAADLNKDAIQGGRFLQTLHMSCILFSLVLEC